jgi:hypothetical protein
MLSAVFCNGDVVPLQPINICGVGLAALGRSGHKEANNVAQKASTFLSTILAFAVQKSSTCCFLIDHSQSESCLFFV